ncbi:hypothetical protein G9F72_021900 [Clostridium estertheticum]|uniref:hypothetical protein n=1 Tax=Clostridium estertheticum TaxID=238834 RepID=UPI0013E8FC0E|nr:hypothetical protein [Clostridium estertheticum]MBZ9688976.1 hypothetical protein [Clostridium estertheticum]
MDVNELLSGLTRKNECCPTRRCCNNNNNNNGIFGGSSLIIIIILLCFCGGFGGERIESGTVCGCDPKHCKELCRCGSSNVGGCGGFGGFGSGFGSWFIIIIIILLFSNNNRNRCCDDFCDE